MPTHADRLAGVLRVLRAISPADAAEVERIHAAEDAEADIADGDDTHPLDAVLREYVAAEVEHMEDMAASAEADMLGDYAALLRSQAATRALYAALAERFGSDIGAAQTRAAESLRRRDARRAEHVAQMDKLPHSAEVMP